jgi:hypothetical protein
VEIYNQDSGLCNDLYEQQLLDAIGIVENR